MTPIQRHQGVRVSHTGDGESISINSTVQTFPIQDLDECIEVDMVWKPGSLGDDQRWTIWARHRRDRGEGLRDDTPIITSTTRCSREMMYRLAALGGPLGNAISGLLHHSARYYTALTQD